MQYPSILSRKLVRRMCHVQVRSQVIITAVWHILDTCTLRWQITAKSFSSKQVVFYSCARCSIRNFLQLNFATLLNLRLIRGCQFISSYVVLISFRVIFPAILIQSRVWPEEKELRWGHWVAWARKMWPDISLLVVYWKLQQPFSNTQVSN